MSDDGPRSGAPDEGFAHLQAAAQEMIGAARAFLDAAEQLVDDPQAVSKVVGVVGGFAKAAAAAAAGAAGDARGPADARPGDAGDDDDDGDDGAVERIEVR